MGSGARRGSPMCLEERHPEHGDREGTEAEDEGVRARDDAGGNGESSHGAGGLEVC